MNKTGTFCLSKQSGRITIKLSEEGHQALCLHGVWCFIFREGWFIWERRNVWLQRDENYWR